jgi:hypothetical protein
MDVDAGDLLTMFKRLDWLKEFIRGLELLR